MQDYETNPKVEHHNRPVSSAHNGSGMKVLSLIVLALVLGIGGFVGGMQYQKGKSTSSSTTLTASTQLSSRGGMQGAMGAAHNGSFGSVTAIGSSSISVQDERTSSTTTYTISSSTTITNDGITVDASSISVGDRVMVQTASTSSTVATQILVNPTMGGAPSGAPTQTN